MQEPAKSELAPTRRVTLLTTTLVVACFGCGIGFGAHGAAPFRVPDRVLVKPTAKTTEANLRALLAAHGAHQQDVIRQIDVRIVQVPSGKLDAVLAALKQNPSVEFAEEDYLLPPEAIPNDPYYAYAWHLPKIGASAAWDLATGSSNVTIAILDSGIEATHPDLAPLLVPGWNFYDNNDNTADVTGHGTPVAGTASAAGNNGQGVVGITWGCRIMPVRICDTNGYASLSTIASGLTWAADQGARVANISYRASSGSTITSAAQYFQAHGGVVAVSAGNNGIFDSSPDNPYVLTVSATDVNDALAPFANTGNNIDLAAPGSDIMTTAAGGDYGSGTGTSFSAPVVAGVAALMVSINPALTGADIQNLLKQSADDLGAPGWDTSYGWGRVQAAAAVTAALNFQPPADTNAPSAAVTTPTPGSTLSNVVTVNIAATDDIGVSRMELFLDGALVATNPGPDVSFAWDTRTVADGIHELSARAYDTANNVGLSSLVSVTVRNQAPPPDTQAPTVAVLTPASGTKLGRMTSVSVAATDNVAVTKVQLLTDGKLYATSFSASPMFSWNTSKLSRGQHTLQAVAFDAAGNSARSAVVTVLK
jgi:subtilisin family serine protease